MKHIEKDADPEFRSVGRPKKNRKPLNTYMTRGHRVMIEEIREVSGGSIPDILELAIEMLHKDTIKQ